VVEPDGKPVKPVAKIPGKKRDKGKRGGRPTKYDAAFVVVLADVRERAETSFPTSTNAVGNNVAATAGAFYQGRDRFSSRID
jgi:hypothetical protein